MKNITTPRTLASASFDCGYPAIDTGQPPLLEEQHHSVSLGALLFLTFVAGWTAAWLVLTHWAGWIK